MDHLKCYPTEWLTYHPTQRQNKIRLHCELKIWNQFSIYNKIERAKVSKLKLNSNLNPKSAKCRAFKCFTKVDLSMSFQIIWHNAKMNLFLLHSNKKNEYKTPKYGKSIVFFVGTFVSSVILFDPMQTVWKERGQRIGYCITITLPLKLNDFFFFVAVWRLFFNSSPSTLHLRLFECRS